ncbi:MAG: hypothetical protein H6707_17930 [Deltaproteobacteria bacterium]|nr:hypothetical protein [Deltaproteobacteria bacterium]
MTQVGEIRLLQAILRRALVDVLSPARGTEGNLHARDAWQWIARKDERGITSFDGLCLAIGLDADELRGRLFVASTIQRHLARPVAAADASTGAILGVPPAPFPHGVQMASKRIAYRCDVISEPVLIRLLNRRRGGFAGRDEPFVECDQRDCQYVGTNALPCPLSLDMFASALAERAEKKAQAGD